MNKYVSSNFAVCNSKYFEEIWEDIKEKIFVSETKELWKKYVFPRDGSINYASFLNYVNWVKKKQTLSDEQAKLDARGENVANSMAFEASKKVMERVKNMNPEELSARDAIGAVSKLGKVFQTSEKIKMDRNEQERNKAMAEKMLDKAIYEGETVDKNKSKNDNRPEVTKKD